MEDNQKVWSGDEKIDQSVQRLLEGNPAFAREHFSEQARLLAVYRMENLLPMLTPFTGSVMKTDLARISLLLTGETAVADQYLLKRDKFKLKEFSTALIEYGFRKAFPDAGTLLEKAGRLQAETERAEMQNAFLEKMLQLTETRGKLESALADANAQNELMALKKKNRTLEEALKSKEAELADAVRKKETAEAFAGELKKKAIDLEKREKEGTAGEKNGLCELLEKVRSSLAAVLDDDQKIVNRLDSVAIGLAGLTENISALGISVSENGHGAAGIDAVMEKLNSLDRIANTVEALLKRQDGQLIRDDLMEIRDLIQCGPYQPKHSKGFFGRRQRRQQPEPVKEPDPELDRLVVGILKNSDYTEGQLAILQAAIEQGIRQGLPAADLSELADPKIPEDNMTKLAGFLFLRRKLVFQAPEKFNGGRERDTRETMDAVDEGADTPEEAQTA